MKTVFVNFPAKVIDNELIYYDHLQAVVESIDPGCIIRVTRKLKAVNIRVSPSHPQYLMRIIEEIKAFHTLYGIRVEFSKSMKKTCNINFDIST